MRDSAPLEGTEAASGVDRRRWLEPGAILALVLLCGVWTWWALEDGAFFGVVWLPAGIVLCAGAALLIAFAWGRVDLRRTPAVGLALAALVALGSWSLLSAIWSPAPDVAIGDGQRILIYAVAFAIALWLGALLGRRSPLALAPVALAAAVAAVATIVALMGGDAARDLLNADGTLQYPLGYRNATAAFFAIAIFPTLGLALDRDLAWPLRAAALATATVCVDFLLLCQSRGSIAAVAVAVVIFILLSPARLRTLCWLVLAALPAIATIGPAGDLYSAAENGLGGVLDEMHTAGRVAALTAGGSLILGAGAALFDRWRPGFGEGPRANRAVAGIVAACLVLGLAGFVAAVGDPIDWADQRLEEFNSGEATGREGAVGRLSLDAGSTRNDMWRVALQDFRDNPLLGDGGGGWQYTWTRDREIAHRDARDAHSVELELLSELGAPGLLLLVMALGGALLGILRARRSGPAASALGAAALAAGTYWLIHSSVDWFWPYPAVTAPVLALLGAACGPAVVTPGSAVAAAGRRSATILRGLLIAGLGVLAVSAVPPFLSERYVNDAYSESGTDPARAYDDLARAHDLNPLSNTPLLAEGAIARAAGDRARAIDAFTEAARKRPEDWASHYLLAELWRDSKPAKARAEIREALALNPLGERNRALADRLGVELPPGPAPPRPTD
ncbi:MAG: hypothetical protein GEU88_14920 [Solirubrobacterales bacterium]|nr:hypothetical protein [Solirubrobacterales bacterium]